MQARIHPHIDRRTRELVETATELSFFVTPGDGFIAIMVAIDHQVELLKHVMEIWKGYSVSTKRLSNQVVMFKVYKWNPDYKEQEVGAAVI